MAKKKETKTQIYEREILEVIKKNRIFSVLDIFAFYGGCSRETFYVHKLHESDTIKDAINKNRIQTKQALKSKWAKSDNPTLQIALYKSICTGEERQALSQQYVANTHEVTEQPLFLDQIIEKDAKDNEA